MNRCFGLVLVLLCVPHALAADVVPSVTIDRTTIRLSESVRVTFTLEGDTPLRVQWPAERLDEQSVKIWRCRPEAAPVLDELPNGRQRWTQTVRVDPYVPGEAVTLGFAPVQVQAGAERAAKPITWKPLEIRVTTTVRGDTLTEMRGGTGIELVLDPPSAGQESALWVVITLLLAAVVFGFVAWIGRRRKARLAVLTLEQSTLVELQDLETAPRELFGEKLTAVLRHYVEARTGTIVSHLTTLELLHRLQPRIEADLQTVLERCDLAKFAGVLPTEAERSAMLQTARQFVSRDWPATEPITPT